MYRCVALGDDQLMLGDPGLLARGVLGGQHIAGSMRFPRCSQGLAAFVPGGGEPAMRRGQVADSVKLVHELQPDGLADIAGVGAAQLVPAADGPDQRGAPLDEFIPRLLVAVSGASYQIGDRRVTTHRVSVLSGGCTEPRLAAAMKVDLPAGHTVGDHPMGRAGIGGCGS